MYKILFISHNDSLFTLLTNLFRLKRGTIISARSGITGIEKAKEVGPDLIVLDPVLPDLSWFNVIMGIKEFHPRYVPIVMIGEGISEIAQNDALNMGIYAIIKDPFQRRELEKIITKVLPDEVPVLPAAGRYAKRQSFQDKLCSDSPAKAGT